MDMEKRTLVAIILSLAILLGWQFFFSAPAPKPAVKEQGKDQAKAEKKEEKPQEQAKPVVIPSARPSEEKDIKVETDLYSAVFSSKGATITKWEIKKHKDKDGISVILQQGQSIVPALSIGSQNNFNVSNVNFSVSGKDMKLDSSTKTGTLTFEYAAPEYSIRRTYTFYNDNYKFDLKDEVTGLPEYQIAVGSDFGIHDKKDESAHVGPILLKDSDRIEIDGKKLKEPKSYTGGLKWIAQEDKYFFAGIVPVTPMDEAKAWDIQGRSIIAFKGKPGANSFMVYAGPKEHERLQELKVGLEHIIDFGFFSIISRPLFWLLKFFYRYLGNYGWAIILITIITRIPFVPLLNKSQKSMKKLQDIQPKMNELREKYKKDPQKLQKETMELYKRHKVNPFGGCLPILLQIPVFFALYKILSIAIELRGAPFMLWVTDLSTKDPYYVLPVVMGITMLIQQKMTPSTADPKQQKIMLLMPVIFTFMFLNFASGLVLYWLVNNVLAIIQQLYVNKQTAKEDESS